MTKPDFRVTVRDELRVTGCEPVNPYKGARPLRAFTWLGEAFVVVRYRIPSTGAHWRNYTALLHDGEWVSDDSASPDVRGDEDPASWERNLRLRFPDDKGIEERDGMRGKLLAAIRRAKGMPGAP